MLQAPFVTYGSSCLCSFAQAAKQTSSESWAHAAPPSPRYSKDDFEIVNGFDSQTVMNTIESTIEEINPELRKLNLDIWGKRAHQKKNIPILSWRSLSVL